MKTLQTTDETSVTWKKAIFGSMWIYGDLDLAACTCTLHIREYAFALAVCKTKGIFAALD